MQRERAAGSVMEPEDAIGKALPAVEPDRPPRVVLQAVLPAERRQFHDLRSGVGGEPGYPEPCGGNAADDVAIVCVQHNPHILDWVFGVAGYAPAPDDFVRSLARFLVAARSRVALARPSVWASGPVAGVASKRGSRLIAGHIMSHST